MLTIKNKPIIYHMPLTDTHTNLGKVVQRANKNKEIFILEKDGIPLAALMNIDDFEDYIDTKDPKLNKQIKQGYREYVSNKARPLKKFQADIKIEHVKQKK